MKNIIKGTQAILANDDYSRAVAVKKFPRIGWFVVKTLRGKVIYDGGDEREAARAIVEYQLEKRKNE